MDKEYKALLKAYRKINNKIEQLVGRNVMSKKRENDLTYLLEAAVRMFEVGDKAGGWSVLRGVGEATPGVKLTKLEREGSEFGA